MSMISVISGSGKSVPGAPTIGTATDTGSGRAYNNGAASVTFTAPTYNGRSAITSYTVTSSPGGFTGTGASSPITVTGLQSAISYTFTVTATNAIGTSAASSASNSITATTIPQTPTITSATRSSNTAVSIAFTGATGGSALTAVTATSSPSVSITSSGTSSPMTATATYAQGTSYTFTITATNANGTSGSSSASSAVTPYPAPALGAWSASTAWPYNTVQEARGASNGSIFWFGGGLDATGSNTTGLAYYWNGSSFISFGMASSRYLPGMQRISDGGTTWTMMSVGGLSSGFSYSQTVWRWDPNNGWDQRGTYPIAACGVGTAALNTSGTVRCVGGENANKESWYSSNYGNTWSTTVAAPWSNNQRLVNAVDNNFNGEAYYFPNNETTPYKVTSTTSGYTAITNYPWGSANSTPLSSATVVSGTVMIIANNPSYTSPYTFNGTTYTAQTAFTAGTTSSTGIGNVGTQVNLIRAESDGTSFHYISTFA